jgi:uncharacterized membrane protein
MRTRRILALVSVLGVVATLIALLEGAWVYALAPYGLSVIALGVLLRRAVRQHRAQADPLRRPGRNAERSGASPGAVQRG